MATGEGAISDTKLLDLVLAADEDALAEGLSPKQRGMATVRKVLKKLGHTFVMTGSGMSPLGERIIAIHRSLYRPSDLAIGGIHGGIYMFRDVFARIYIPFGYGQMSIDPFQLTDFSETQLRWLASRPEDLATFHDQFIDIFDFAGTVGRLGDYKMPPKDAQELLQLASFQLQAAAAALSVAFDYRGAVQSSLIGAELALKAGLAALGVEEKERRKYGHDLASIASTLGSRCAGLDLNRVLNTTAQLPAFVDNRYSAEQPGRVEVGHIVMRAQYLAGEVARQIGGYSIRSAITPVTVRLYP